MALVRITDPTSRCITFDEAKEFRRIRGSTAEDALIEVMVGVSPVW